AQGSNWEKVHQMLVDFNRRPIVHVEGVDAGGGAEGGYDGPRVVGVYAGEARGYAQEPTRDGIHYTVLGATAARSDQDASEMIRGFTLLRFDAGGGENAAEASVIETAGRFDAQRSGPIAPDDIITGREREILDAIAAITPAQMGVEGILQPDGGSAIL